MHPQLAANINLFFRDPTVTPILPGRFGVLYLLRRDVRSCISQRVYLFPATMALLAGIDLVAKFHDGDDSIKDGAVGKRFKAFIHIYFQPLSDGDEKLVYALRNALLHSFGLFSENRSFQVMDVFADPPIQPLDNNAYRFSVQGLHERFELAISRYHVDLERDPDLQAKFARMFDRYGYTDLGYI